jgi:secreted trypsin-like serine protease
MIRQLVFLLLLGIVLVKNSQSAVNVIDANVMESIVDDKKPSRCNCGTKTIPDRILGGEDADEHEHPWVVEVTIGCVHKVGFVSCICGGSVLSKRHVLTAAHCFTDAINRQG